MAVRRSMSWAAFTRPPGGVGRRAVATTTGLMFVGGGALAWMVTLLDGGPTTGAVGIRVLGGVAVAVGAVLLVAGSRLRPVAHQALLLLASAMITVGVLISGGGTVAMAIGMLCLLVVVNLFTLTSWLGASVHASLALVGVALALSHVPGVGTAPTAMAACVVLLVGVFAGRQVRVTAAAEIDPLTGLLNRRGLDQRLDEVLERAERIGSGPVVAVVDLDHFKAVNDRGGHAAGDLLLEAVARAWTSVVPLGAVVARTGGDEFVLVVPSGAAAGAPEVVDRLRLLLPQGVTCSAGTARWEPGDSASQLIHRADTALYVAKRAGRGTTRHHAGAVTDAGPLRAAIADGQLEVHYQPVVDLVTGETVAAEALVRWRHPERGLVPPDAFLPQAELNGAIVDVGRFVLHRALHDAAAWPPGPRGPRSVAVNVSGSELADPAFFTRVRASLAASGLPAQALVVEITEGLLDLESPVVVGTLRALREHGVRIAMDDFGTGYSTLARLSRLRLDVLKIDRSFVSVVRGPDSEAPLVTSILALATALRLQVVAEGVETPEQAQWLRDRGCDEAQGYLWSAAVPQAQMLARLASEPVAATTARPAQVPALPAVPTPRAALPTVPAPAGLTETAPAVPTVPGPGVAAVTAPAPSAVAAPRSAGPPPRTPVAAG